MYPLNDIKEKQYAINKERNNYRNKKKRKILFLLQIKLQKIIVQPIISKRMELTFHYHLENHDTYSINRYQIYI